ncbi:MAG: 16S rRNA (cytosine(1402)-N(4))-methyltransferase RsmH [Vicinamibacteria bacterium]
MLLPEVLELVAARPGGLYVDATLGGGGYTEALLRASDPSGRVVAFDRDREAIEAAKERLRADSDRLSLVWGSFVDVDEHLDGLVELVSGIVADLGLSSLQLDDADRGFAFGAEGPLDMRFDRSQDLTAEELVNHMDERELERVLRDYGDERRARAIARRIVSRRPLRTTTDLRRAVVSVLGPWKGGIDPATRTFQAIRIAVNRELEVLETFLEKAPDRLRVEGRLVVVAYHSLEDRAVKLAFRARAKGPFAGEAGEGSEGRFRLLTKKPLTAGPLEVARNRRARSAKLRALERVA